MLSLIGCGSDSSSPPSGSTTVISGTYEVRGQILTNDGSYGVANVKLTFSNGFVDQTYTEGRWYENFNGTVTITPSKTGCTFDPTSQTVSTAANNVNFKLVEYSDDFSDTSSGWGGGSGAVVGQYKNNQFNISFTQNREWGFGSIAPIVSADSFTVEADATLVSGTGSYGIFINMADSEDPGIWDLKYYFAIDPISAKYTLFRLYDITA